MKADKVEQVLCEADRLAGAAPPIAGDLAGRVRQLARQRRRVHIRNGALAAGVAIVVTVLISTRFPAKRGGAPGPIVNQDDSSVVQQLLALRAEAQRLGDELINLNLQAVSDSMAEAAVANLPDKAGRMPAPPSTAHRAVAHRPEADIHQELDEQLERAAYLFVYQAERYQRELNMPNSAMASYRQAVELFPRTRAAEKARIQLTRFENEKGNSL